MRIYSTLATTCVLLEQKPASHDLTKAMALRVTNQLAPVLEFSFRSWQWKTCYFYLIGLKTSSYLEETMTPAEARAIIDLKAWVNCEFSGWIKPTVHVISNLNTGKVVVFQHGWL